MDAFRFERAERNGRLGVEFCAIVFVAREPKLPRAVREKWAEVGGAETSALVRAFCDQTHPETTFESAGRQMRFPCGSGKPCAVKSMSGSADLCPAL